MPAPRWAPCGEERDSTAIFFIFLLMITLRMRKYFSYYNVYNIVIRLACGCVNMSRFHVIQSKTSQAMGAKNFRTTFSIEELGPGQDKSTKGWLELPGHGE